MTIVFAVLFATATASILIAILYNALINKPSRKTIYIIIGISFWIALTLFLIGNNNR